MNAQDLLEFLLNSKSAGVDLTQYTLMTKLSTYDELTGYTEHEREPDEIELYDDYLILK